MILRMISMLIGIALASYGPFSNTVISGLFSTGLTEPLASKLVVGALLLALLLVDRALHCGIGKLAAVRQESPHVLLSQKSLLRTARFSLPALLWCAAGLGHGLVYASNLSQHMLLPEYEGELVELQGTVVGLPRQEVRYGKTVQRFDLRVVSARWPVSVQPLRRVRLSWYEGPNIRAGQQWTLRAKLKRPRGLANPAGFDYQLYLHLHEIDASGSVRWGREGRFTEPVSMRWEVATSRLRSELAGLLNHAGADLESLRFIRALAVGDGKALTAADWELLRRTGTSHLFVISGLHIGMLGGVVYAGFLLLFRLLAVFRPTITPQRLAAVVACMAAFLYAALAGFSLPTQRAVLMFSAAIIGRSFALPVPLSNVFFLAAFIACVLEPLAMRSASFWLSFLAVGALLLAFSGRIDSSTHWFRAAARAQWVSFIALSPVLLFWFNASSLSMPLVNLVAVPLVSALIVPLVFVNASLLALPTPHSESLLRLLDATLNLLWQFLGSADRLTGEWSEFSLAIEPRSLASLLLASAILLAPLAVRKRMLYLLPFLLLSLLAPSLTIWLKIDKPGVVDTAAHCETAKLKVLDVGQGLAITFSAYGKTLLYDTGARFSDSFDIGSAVVWPQLLAENVRTLDVVVLSHADNDHFGGFATLRDRLAINSIYSSFMEPDLQATACTGRHGWSWRDVDFQFLNESAAAQGAGSSDRNNGSCVLKITAPGFSALLPGDIEYAAEKQLLKLGAALKSDLLVVPHHGSKSSSTHEFIAAVDPGYALVSAGYKNRFGHPHPAVVSRYKKQGSRVLNTALSGLIEFTLPLCADAEQLEPTQYRQRAGNYWLRW